jgi:hypothetical protein
MVSSIDNPLIFGCLALDIAGYKIAEIGNEISADDAKEGFQLVFNINENLTLSLSHDNGSDDYVIIGSIPAALRQASLLEMALKLNFVLLEQRRSFSIDPSSEALILTQLVNLSKLELENLAEAIADVTQTVLALDGYEFDDHSSDRNSAPVDWSTVVRG